MRFPLATNPFKSLFGNKSLTDSQGLTQKQKDSEAGVHPSNGGFSQPEPKPDFAQEATKTKQTPPQTSEVMQGTTSATKQGASTTAVDPVVADMNARLGQASLAVKAAMGKFLGGGVSADVKSTQSVNYVPGTAGTATVGTTPGTAAVPGSFQISGDTSWDSEAAAKLKAEELQKIKDSADFKMAFKIDAQGNVTPKTFDDVIKERIASGEIGSYGDVTTDQKLDHMFLLAKQLKAMEAAGRGDSAEAQAIQQTIDQEDDTGAMAGLQMATRKFNQLTGQAQSGNLEWSGDEGSEAKNVADITSLTTSQLKDEIDSAMKDPASGGLFGGDWALNMQKEVDRESSEFKLSSSREKELNDNILQASQAYLDDFSTQFSAQDKEINTQLSSVGPAIQAAVKGTAGEAWFEQAAKTGLAAAFRAAVYDPESGLAEDQRKILEKYLGGLTGEGADSFRENGLLSKWMKEISTTGSFTGEDGKKVSPNADQKLEILNILSDKSLDAAGKKKALTEAFAGVAREQNGKLTSALSDVVSGNKTLGEATKQMISGSTDSILSFSGSKTEEAVMSILGIKDDAAWKAMTPEARSRAMSAAIIANPQLTQSLIQEESARLADNFNKSYNKILKDSTEKVAAVKAQKTKLVTDMRAKTLKDIETVRKNVLAKMQAASASVDPKNPENVYINAYNTAVQNAINEAAAKNGTTPDRISITSPLIGTFNVPVFDDKGVPVKNADGSIQYKEVPSFREAGVAYENAAKAKQASVLATVDAAVKDGDYLATLIGTGSQEEIKKALSQIKDPNLLAALKQLDANWDTAAEYSTRLDGISSDASNALKALEPFKENYTKSITSPQAIVKLNMMLSKKIEGDLGITDGSLSEAARQSGLNLRGLRAIQSSGGAAPIEVVASAEAQANRELGAQREMGDVNEGAFAYNVGDAPVGTAATTLAAIPTPPTVEAAITAPPPAAASAPAGETKEPSKEPMRDRGPDDVVAKEEVNPRDLMTQSERDARDAREEEERAETKRDRDRERVEKQEAERNAKTQAENDARDAREEEERAETKRDRDRDRPTKEAPERADKPEKVQRESNAARRGN